MTTRWTAWPAFNLTAVLTLAAAGAASGQEKFRLAEQFPAGYQFSVDGKTTLKGELTVPGEREKDPPQKLALTGESRIRYDERILVPPGAGADVKTFRVYRDIEFRRRVGDQFQETTVRKGVRRMVVMRLNQTEVPFSPDGPLTWGELDQVRTDVFTPALAGLLPERAVSPGESWPAAAAAVAELTDMEVGEGVVECVFSQVARIAERRHAVVTFRGTVTGVSEDGRGRQQLEGTLFFDLESNHVSIVNLKGVHSLLDKTGQTVGRIEGNFTINRQVNLRLPELGDDALGRVTLDRNAENTQLLYTDPELGLEFLYPRRWRVGVVRGRGLDVDEAGGAGLRLTLEPTAKVPTVGQFQEEVRAFLTKEKAKVTRADPPRRLADGPRQLDFFRVEAEVGGKALVLDYYILRQNIGGAVVAARFAAKDREAAGREVEAIVRGLTLTRRIEEEKK